MADRIRDRHHTIIKHWPIVVLRVYAGVFFANAGIAKLGRDNFADGMTGFVRGNLDSSFSFYRPFLESVVLPNADIFAAFVAWGELAIGIGLVLGFATRYAAFIGAFMVANFWFTKGADFLAGTNHDVVWIFILLVLGLIPAGRIAGLDDGLSDRMRFLR